MSTSLEKIKGIRIEDYDYPLPDGRIALHPLADRESCLLLTGGCDGRLAHRRFADLPELLPEGTQMFCNNTRVIHARIEMHKATGGRIEIFLLEPLDPADYNLAFQARGECRWKCMVGNRKKWKEGTQLKDLEVDGAIVTIEAALGRELSGNAFEVTFRWPGEKADWAAMLQGAGRIPIPPYLNRDSEKSDETDYQTVYARVKGSVAAPTAGLHFTDALISRLAARGIGMHPVTLHVGAGTFQPVKSEQIGDHPMHTETFSITRGAVALLARMKREGKPVGAVGTTTVRTLESLPWLALRLQRGLEPHVDQWEAYAGEEIDASGLLQWLADYMEKEGLDELPASTSIMIAPGFRWRVVDLMVTNFHQPQSTLLLLVSSFLRGGDLWRRYYDAALAGDYRFLSYGDACLFFRS